MKKILLLGAFCTLSFLIVNAQEKPKPSDTEFYTPVPVVVSPGKTNANAPSDAIILFDGKNLDQWVSVKDKSPAKWIVKNGAFTENKSTAISKLNNLLITINCI